MQAISTYGSRLYNISLFVLKNEVLAEDSTQESFQKIWKALDPFFIQFFPIHMDVSHYSYNNALTTYNREKKHKGQDIEYEGSVKDFDIN